MPKQVFGIFRYEDEFIEATRRLHQGGHENLVMMSPIPMHGIEEILKKKKPVIRRFTFFGALTGAVGGFALASLTALAFITPTGGRPIIPFPPFLVISYEMTILFGVLATLLGFHIASGLPAWDDKPYDLRTNVDRFSILAECESDADAQAVEVIMREAGAEEIDHPGEAA